MVAFRHEAFSFFTHLAGALAGVVGLVALVLLAEDGLAVAAFAVYGGTLIVMFATSCLHHIAHRDDGIFRRLDMTSIYLFIAGSYTPMCLLAMPPRWGVPVLVAAWSFAAVGIALRWLRPLTPRWVTVGLYLGMGWMAFPAGFLLVDAVGWAGLALLVAGGAVYSVGAVVYARKRPDPWPRFVGYHGLWHVFVMGGAALHFALVWLIARS